MTVLSRQSVIQPAGVISDERKIPKPTQPQLRWLSRGLDQPGGKLPLFDQLGQRVSERTVRSCIDNGWAESWFANPIKPDWLICRLTETGYALVAPSA